MRWQGREALGIGVTMVKGGDVIDLGRALDAKLVPVEAAASRRRRNRARRQHAARGRALGARIPALARRSGHDRACGVAREPRLAHGACGRRLDPARARDDVRLHGHLRHRPPQDLARRADPLARAPRRRRDHRGRDDGDQAGAGIRPLPRGELRLHQHCVPDADRHARDRRRIPADRDREERDRRVHALAVRSVGDRADRVVVRRRDRDSLPRLSDAARFHEAAARLARRHGCSRACADCRSPRRARRRTATPTTFTTRPSTGASARSSTGASRTASS